MNKIQEQATKLWDLLFNPETGDTYKRALTLTWDIIKESAKLIWLVACLLFVGFAWGWVNSVQAGRSMRAWYSNIEDPKVNHVFGEAGRRLMLAGSSSADYAIDRAMHQLGIETELKPMKAIAPEPEPEQTSTSKSSFSAASKPQSSPTSTTPSSLDENAADSLDIG